MTIQVDATYSNGVLHLRQPISLPDGAEVRIAIESGAEVPGPSPTSDPLAYVIGLADGPPAGDVASRHDDYLYGPS